MIKNVNYLWQDSLTTARMAYKQTSVSSDNRPVEEKTALDITRLYCI
jgi:hypothetical protein